MESARSSAVNSHQNGKLFKLYRLLNPIRWLVKSTKQRGFRQTAAIGLGFAEDYLFDLRHGTDTVRSVEMDALPFSAENKSNSSVYGATKARPFLTLMKELKLPKTSTFVDFGSGKGRVLMLASQAGFKRVIGVEFSPELCQIARRNLQKFQAKTGTGHQVEIQECDATQFEITPDQQIFYMFNPFNAKIVGQVIANIGRSIAIAPRPCWLIYLIPLQHETVVNGKVFRTHLARTLYGAEYQLYTT